MQIERGTTADSGDKEERPLKIAFINPYNLFDASSGAVQSVRTMLEQLALRGASCHALMSCCFDVPPGEHLPQLLQSRGLVHSAEIKAFNLPVWQGNVQGVSCQVVQFQGQQRNQLNAVEELVFRDTVRVWLADNRPDVVITFGGLLLDIELQRCIRHAGAVVAFYLANPSYGRPETFERVDLILANSGATQEHYFRMLNLRAHCIGLFVDTGPIIASQRDPQFVTFINPLPEKGVSLFLRLVQKAAIEAPDMRFLVVESRGVLADAIQKIGFPAELLKQVVVLPKQENMAAVYAKTAILLLPSFWFEAAGRVLMEANANGIPVLATNRGGIPETLGSAGCLLPIPDRCAANHWEVPTDEEIRPWWDELRILWYEPAYRNALSRQAIAVAATQTLAHKTASLEILLRLAVKEKRRENRKRLEIINTF